MAASGDERSRRGPGVRPRWPAVTRTTVSRTAGSRLGGQMLPALVSDVRAEPPSGPSERHLELVQSLAGAPDWSSRALHACLSHLLTSRVTEASRALIVDAWPDPEDGLCVVYRPPHDEGRVVGLRRRRRDALEPSDWRIGDLTTWGYDMGPDIDAERFGWNVADFDIGEPLGYVTTVLHYDAADIGWWGSIS